MPAKRGDDEPIDEVVARLDDEVARRLLASAAEWHEDVMRAVRLAAAGESERLAVLKAAVDDGLRTRRHLDYWASSAWARDAAPVVDALAEEVATEPSAELVLLLQRAAGHLTKVILRADDSHGLIGDLCREVLDLHRRACAAGVADPQKLAKWMVKYGFEDQDFFEIDPSPTPMRSGTRALPSTGERSPSGPIPPTHPRVDPRCFVTSTAASRASPPGTQPNVWR